ncbi:hypothetical protein ACFF01_006544, partial [Pseudomonas aeruginosa]
TLISRTQKRGSFYWLGPVFRPGLGALLSDFLSFGLGKRIAGNAACAGACMPLNDLGKGNQPSTHHQGMHWPALAHWNRCKNYLGEHQQAAR